MTFASLGEHLNSLLESFFEKGPQEITIPVADSGDEFSVAAEKKVDIPEEVTVSDFEKEIFAQEQELDQFSLQTELAREDLSDILKEKTSVENQLFFLKQDEELLQKKWQRLSLQRQEWQEKLEAITREKSELRTRIRVEERSFDVFLSKNFIQSQNFGISQDSSIFRWLFSDKTVAEILESQSVQKQYETDKRTRISKLKELKVELDAKEKFAANLYARLEKLSHDMGTEQVALRQLLDAQGRIQARLELSAGERQAELEAAERARRESEVVLVHLREGLDKAREGESLQGFWEEFGTPEPAVVTAGLDFPLKIEKYVTAKFRDPDYKVAMGREHLGMDVRAPQGTPIYAPADAIVRKVASNGYQYSYLILQHDEDLYTVYGHVSDILVKKGQKVLRGEKIALTGGTPGTPGAGYFTTGPHLHLEVFKDGKHVDPADYIGA
ncbi:peptidoglycan DD-metalloendopeptidase family protein [Candidatus Gracilibacteria bacterium]|nr:peptidoglycan DD-metalloendopeptidase family protein [Candidatus Gracilibacteria bacterium]